jgi:CRP/FNR family cyclic AMP-dependent transcriptional regulator
MPKYPQSDILRRLFNKGQPLTAAKGEILLGQSAVPDGVYFISTGYVKVYSISNKGDEYIHIIYGPGEVFPIMWAYLEVQPETMFYETLVTTVVWRIARDWFEEFVKTRIDISYAMSMQLAQQFRVYNDRVDNLEYKKASERVAYRVLFLGSRFGNKTERGVLIDLPITHEVFANTINLARESVSRELEKLEKQNILELQDHHILIKDVKALASQLSRPVDLDRWYLS